eukprot:8956591-Pyramimonas_sp.AAC.1
MPTRQLQLLAVHPKLLEVRPAAVLAQVEVRLPLGEVPPARQADHVAGDLEILQQRVLLPDAQQDDPLLL